MSRYARVVGNLLIVAGLLALGYLTLPLAGQLAGSPEPFVVGPDAPLLEAPVPPERVAASPPRAAASPLDAPLTTTREELPRHPITRLLIPTLDLEAPVAPAPFLDDAAGGTWSVPQDRAGHADGSAGAGQPGNAVLFGHVSWNNRPGVFAQLHRLQPGDAIDVFAEADTAPIRYRVAARGSVTPTDASPVDPTPRPALTLITCDGLWLPLVWDYTHRLVVRAHLEHPP